MSIVDGLRSVRGEFVLSDNGVHTRRGGMTSPARSKVELWSKTYRDGLPCAAITFPAAALRRSWEAAAVKRAGHCVDVRSGTELTLAVAAGIAPARIVMHDDGVTAGPLRRAVLVGAGRFVIGCHGQVSVLESCARGPHRVVVDMTALDPRAIEKVVTSPRLQLIGLHLEVDSSASTVQRFAEVIAELIAQMAHIRRRHGVLLTRISVGGGAALTPRPLTRRSLAPLNSAIEDAIDDGCARHRFPRPVLVVSPAP